MISLLAIPALLANSSQPAPRGMGGTHMLLALVIAMFVFMFVMQRGTRKAEEKKRNQLLNSLKKNDRVMTHGGIIGTVVTVKEREVVLKVDESTNTKMTFLKEAIRQVIDDAGESDRS